SVTVFPESLERAEGPAEPLANQSAGRFRCCGPLDGCLVITDAPTEAPNTNGQVRVFRNGVRGEPSRCLNGLFSPRTQSTRDYGDEIQKIEGALFHILAGDVFERLPSRKPPGAVANFDVAGNGANGRVGKMAQ